MLDKKDLPILAFMCVGIAVYAAIAHFAPESMLNHERMEVRK